MAATSLSLSDNAIDRMLAEAESRLAAKESGSKATAITAVPGALAVKSSLAVAAPLAPSAGDQRATSKKASEKLTVRVPQLSRPKKESKDTAGSDWFNMPRTNLTPQLKADLQMLRMRDVAAMGKQFFKKDNNKPFVPEFCQVGTLISGATDGANNRLTKKERKRTIVEEVLAGHTVGKFKEKYQAIQEKNQSGRKGHYKKVVATRRKRN
ncbi:Fcf2 pre-rRNA processing-domain-containing protein [Podospora didyma]|uniref:Fcf2 pre-rRNA processing-domain-containing protein n=1 Tax=Podospora didyma TaxID=330526 RepID=A0AAE0N2V6_9PEZI|nr:Fcf2 pre-rRNA processing-domain-containing protein [Podospora didyma]